MRKEVIVELSSDETNSKVNQNESKRGFGNNKNSLMRSSSAYNSFDN